MFLHRKIIFTATVFLLSGVIVYWLCRPQMLLFRWFGLAQTPVVNRPLFLAILNNYYGDLAWVSALCFTVVYLTGRKLAGRSSVFSLLALPFIAEAAQAAGLIRGVFDWFDILLYALVIGFFLIRFPKHFLI
jgi:hypothetical protein